MNERTEFVLKAMSPRANFGQLCQQYAVSRKTGYKWKARFLAEGLGGLQERSRRPHGNARELSEGVVCELIRLKMQYADWGPKKIGDLYSTAHGWAPSLSTIKRVFSKAGLVKKRRKRPQRTQSRLARGIKATCPNQVWSVDFKGWWRDSQGKRCEPLTVRDEYSRFVLDIRALDNAGTEAVKEAFERLFSQYGLPEVIRSDNGTPFASTKAVLGLSRLSVWWIALGIDLERNRPGHPQDNGAHERLHRDIRTELQGTIEGDRRYHQQAFDLWRQQFNWERPHEALQMRRPGQLYHKSSRPFSTAAPQIVYPTTYCVRKVSPHGLIKLNGAQVFISTSLRGRHLGMRPVHPDLWEVYFDHLRLGELRTDAQSFIPTQTLPGTSVHGSNKKQKKLSA
jgi:transposase InsO family protein